MAATYERISNIVSTGTTSSVTFSSIPATYTDLVLILKPITDNVTGAYPYLRFNSDSGTNYSRTFIRGNGTTASTDRASNENIGYIIGGNVIQLTSQFIGLVSINDYSNTTTNKMWLSRTNVAIGTDASAEALIGLWRNTSAINNISIFCGGTSFVSGSTFALYGIKAGS